MAESDPPDPPKGAGRGHWDDRGKCLGSVTGSGGAVQSVLEGVRQMGGLMIVAFVAPVNPCGGSGASATSIRFEALRSDLKREQAGKSNS
jgi:hypothetical protein